MKDHARKVAAAVCTAAFLVSVTSCDIPFLAGQTEETVAETTDPDEYFRSLTMSLWNELTEGMKERDKERVRAVFRDPSDTDLEIIDLSGKTEDEIRIIEDIAGTVSGEFTDYTVDDTNVCIAGVNVSIADHETVLSDPEYLTDIQTLEEAILGAPLKEFTVDVVLDKGSDDTYRIANINEIMETVYVFFDLEFEIAVEEIEETSVTEPSSQVTGSSAEWIDTYSDHLYTNTDHIRADLTVGDDTGNISADGISYAIEYNGVTVAQGTGGSALYDITQGECDTTYTDCLAAGEYRVTFYSEGGDVLCTDSVTVSVATRNMITSADVTGVIWYGTDNGSVSGAEEAVYTDTDSLDLQLVYDQAMCDVSGVYCVVTLGGDALYTSPAGSGHCIYGIEEGAETYYNGHMAQGDYTITFFNNSGEVIASASCSVLIGR